MHLKRELKDRRIHKWMKEHGGTMHLKRELKAYKQLYPPPYFDADASKKRIESSPPPDPASTVACKMHLKRELKACKRYDAERITWAEDASKKRIESYPHGYTPRSIPSADASKKRIESVRVSRLSA